MVAGRLVAVLLFALGVGLPGPVAGAQPEPGFGVGEHSPIGSAVPARSVPPAAIRLAATPAPAEVGPSTVDAPASRVPGLPVFRRGAGVQLLLALAGGILATALAIRTTRRARRAGGS
jgi:hypothetical protein